MSRFAILLLLLVLGLLASAVLRSRVPAAYRGLSLMTMNILVTLALLELIAGGILRLLPSPPAAFLADRANAESTTYYADKPWARAFWREHWPALTRHAFRPFALWESGVSTGRYVNVGRDHLRRTPGSNCGPGSVRVFVFGGSTIWGWGAPDSGTIPARLQSALAAQPSPVCVVNFGQLGYVTTQELITLQQQLQAGNVPDLAIFYDAFNDCLPVQMGFGPGGHWTQDDIERRLTVVTTANPVRQLLRSSYTFRLADRLRRQFGGPPRRPSDTWTPPVARLTPDSVAGLAAAAAAVYLANSRAGLALARGFGFEYAAFIQPWTGTTRNPERWGPLRGTVMADSGMCGKYYDRIRAAAGREPHVYDLSDTFDTTSASVYIDRVHLTPDGNDQIARRIAGILTSTSGMLRRHAPDPSPEFAMTDLSVNFAGIRSPNPFWLASGPPTNTYGQVARAFDAGWGGAVWKTIGEPIINVYSRYGSVDFGGQRMMGFNNIELISDRPTEENLKEIAECKRNYPDNVVIASLMVESKREAWHDIMKRTQDTGADGVELNFGCPHGMSERGMGAAVGQVPDYACQIVGWVKEVATIPVIVKLTPNVTDVTYVARAAKKGGGDAISLINTINSIVSIDLDSFSPTPSVGGHGSHGGYCGPAVKPIALNMVSACAADPEVGIPISGIGGIATWRDAAEFIALGSTTVQVCTAAMHYGFRIVEDLKDGLANWMDERGYRSITDFVGKAVPNVKKWEDLDLNYFTVAKIDYDKCIECELCFAACEDGAHQAIRRNARGNGGHAVEIIDEACVGCNLCSLVCPVDGCITMTRIPNGATKTTWKDLGARRGTLAPRPEHFHTAKFG